MPPTTVYFKDLRPQTPCYINPYRHRLPGGSMAEKELIETADFTNLAWKLEGVRITEHMQKVLYAL